MKQSSSTSRFIPASLPQWELSLCYAVWAFHSLAAFAISYRTCIGPVYEWIEHWMKESSYLPNFRVDVSDSEWLYYKMTIGQLVVAYAGSSLVFMLSYRYLDAPMARYLQMIAGLVLHVWVTSPSCILSLSVFAVLTIALTAYTRRQVIPWVLCVAFILQATQYLPFSIGFIYYREFNMYLYGAIKILNVCISLCRNPDRSSKGEYSLEILHYLTYLPYSMTIIVLFEDFQAQVEARTKSENVTKFTIRDNIIFGLRLLLWAVCFDLLLHVIPVSAIFSSPFTLITGMNGYELSSIAYVAGQYFHIKYVVIFGVPSLFARIDGLVPPPPPICISRVSRYSRMWRHFDAGLYSFLKTQVYLPIITHPALSSVSRPLALLAAFAIVIVWHGAKRHFLCWVALSAVELVIERIGVAVWDADRFQKLRNTLGEVWLRRLVAMSMLATVIPGIFGVFFFLGNEGIGETIFTKVLVQGAVDIGRLNIGFEDGVPTAGWVFLHLLVLGYFFNNVCLELEYKEKRKKFVKDE